MKQLNSNIIIMVVVCLVAITTGCSPSKGDKTGHEYMPDMAHSIAYEANYYNYYEWNRSSVDTAFRKMVDPRKPVSGTIPRGYAGWGRNMDEFATYAGSINEDWMPVNGFAPYYYEDSDSGRAVASAQITSNPFPITQAGLAKGKELYDVFCAICHGEKGEGNGYIITNEKYPAVPPSYLSEDMLASNDGRYYHAIYYGKGVMGSYKDKLSFEERWQVIHYIRSLQASSQGKEYREFVRTKVFDASAAKEMFTLAATAGKVTSEALILDNVLFETGSAKLVPTSKTQLDVLVGLLKGSPVVRIQINGHTDNVGDAKSNLTLSENRAKSVSDYLISTGIEKDRIAYKGFGQDKPTASNETEEGKKRNRRTDFNILKN